MPTELAYRDDAYAREITARVVAASPEGVVLDRTVFYARAGGQPGDAGTLRWAGGEMAVGEALKGPDDTVLHVPAAGAALPQPGAEVTAVLDWDRRFASPAERRLAAVANRDSGLRELTLASDPA